MIENSNLKNETPQGLTCEDGLNWYAYVGNNPMGFVDPTGLITVIAEDIVQETVSGRIFSNESGSIRDRTSIRIDRPARHTEGHYRSRMQVVTETSSGEEIPLYGNDVQSWADYEPDDPSDFTLPAGKYEGQLYGISKQYDNPIILINEALGATRDTGHMIHPNEQSTRLEDPKYWSNTGSSQGCQVTQGHIDEYNVFTSILKNSGFRFGTGYNYHGNTIDVFIDDPRGITTLRDSVKGKEVDVHNIPR